MTNGEFKKKNQKDWKKIHEMIFGREVVTRLPTLVKEWVEIAVARGDKKIEKQNDLFQ